MQHIITRVGHCPLCVLTKSPRTDQAFLAYGSTSKKYNVLYAERNGRIGYTPHIYKGKIVGDNVIVEKVCAMYGCGVDRKPEIDHWFYFTKSDAWTREIWTLKTWQALIDLKHNDFTYMYEI